MSMKLFALIPTLACIAVTALALVAQSAAASGPAVTGDFSFQESISGIEPDFVCQPAPTGVITGTETVTGHFTVTAEGVHVRGTSTQDYRIDFADGRYLTSSSPSHFEFELNLLKQQTVSTEAQQDPGTLYASDGQAIGSVTVFTLTHITWRDLNGNGAPDPGEITANVSQFRVTCP
jgi:hypothetical protein